MSNNGYLGVIRAAVFELPLVSFRKSELHFGRFTTWCKS